jgi:hypothetical protein
VSVGNASGLGRDDLPLPRLLFLDVEVLLAAGADPTAVNSLGHTAQETARGVEPKCDTTRALLGARRPAK